MRWWFPGDLSDDGQDEQLEMVAAAWRDVFPGDALPDGSHVEPIFIYGNHDSSSLSYGVALRNIKTAAARWGGEEEGRGRDNGAWDPGSGGPVPIAPLRLRRQRGALDCAAVPRGRGRDRLNEARQGPRRRGVPLPSRELPQGTPIRFAIRPLNCFGLPGLPIRTDPVSLPLE